MWCQTPAVLQMNASWPQFLGTRVLKYGTLPQVITGELADSFPFSEDSHCSVKLNFLHCGTSLATTVAFFCTLYQAWHECLILLMEGSRCSSTVTPLPKYLQFPILTVTASQ
jgi:hypothetical protein